MTTKRKEIFFNQVLAFDEIDRLFDKKALCKFTRHDQNGAQPVSGCLKRHPDGTLAENLIMKGNNLLALHSLRFLIDKKLLNKIKLIYIDPPYNTEDDSFAYNDKFTRSTWLTFMKNRLEIARELLADDGAIYVNLDYHEVHYCKILMDEIFGEHNFQREIIWRIGWVSGYKTAVANYIRNHDTILFYSKNKQLLNFNKHYIANQDFKALVDLDKKTKDTFAQFGIDKKVAEQILHEINFSNRPERYPLEDVWNANEYDDLNSIAIVSYSGESVSKMLDVDEIKGQKSEKLLKRILEAHTQPNDIVLDFFGGSGTTAAVAHKMNRQYIILEQIDKQVDTIVKRLSKVLVNEQSGISKAVNWQGGGDFVYAELAPFNETAKQQILACENSGSLKTLFDTLCEKYFLKYNVNVNDFAEKIMTEPEFQNMPLDEQKRMVLEMLDLNQMYVHFSEMDDAQFSGCLNENDKALNHDFYGE